MHITSESIDAARQRLQAMPGKDNPRTAIRKLRSDIEAKLADGLTYKDIGPEVHAGLDLGVFGIKPENTWRVIAAALRHSSAPPAKDTAKDKQARSRRRRKSSKVAQEQGKDQPSLFPEADP